MRASLRFMPIFIVVLLVGVLLWRIASPGEQTIRSRLVGKPVPAFSLPAAAPGKPGLSARDLASGKPQLLNIFASWCVPCIAEAPLLGEMKRRGVPIAAIAVRDRPDDVAAFLARHGDPFTRIGSDATSQVQLALGSAGVPETFVIDGAGVIRYQHIGIIEPGDVPELMRQLDAAR